MVGDVNQFTDFSSNKNQNKAFSVNLSYQTRQNWALYSRDRGTLRFEKENTSQTVSVPLKACKRISFFRSRNDI